MTIILKLMKQNTFETIMKQYFGSVKPMLKISKIKRATFHG